jgi:hypothetical protein
MKGYIYKISSPLIKEFYIGSTSRPNRRKYEHWKRFNRNKHSATQLQEIVNQYGLNLLNFDVIIETDVETRNELFDIEQQVIDDALSKNLPVCNKNLNVCKNISSERIVKTYEEYRIITIVKEIDGFYYHIAQYLQCHRDSLNKLFKGETYVEFFEEYNKENLTFEEKLQIYYENVETFIEYTHSQNGLTCYEYLQILAYDYFNIRRDDVAKIMEIHRETTIDIIGDNRERYNLPKDLFSKMSFIERLNLIKDTPVKINRHSSKGGNYGPPFTMFCDAVFRREDGEMIKDIAQSYGVSVDIISKYVNGRGPLRVQPLFNTLTDEDKQAMRAILRSNPLLLPRDVKI